MVNLYVKRLRPTAQVPKPWTEGSVGLDLHADISEPVELLPGRVVTIPTGIAVQIPDGHEGQVRSRSGLAQRGVFVVNSPGTIDPDYTQEVQVILSTLTEPYTISPGDRIAQLVICPVADVHVAEVRSLARQPSTRKGGFGHTGK
jgi:dUTP pyrophosphatase